MKCSCLWKQCVEVIDVDYIEAKDLYSLQMSPSLTKFRIQQKSRLSQIQGEARQVLVRESVNRSLVFVRTWRKEIHCSNNKDADNSSKKTLICWCNQTVYQILHFSAFISMVLSQFPCLIYFAVRLKICIFLTWLSTCEIKIRETISAVKKKPKTKKNN